MLKPMSKRFLGRLSMAFIVALSGVANASTIYINDASQNLATVDTDTGAATIIGNMGVAMTDIAFDPYGNLFGISFTDLYSIDATSGATTLIGAHGVAGGNGLVFGSNGILYSTGYLTTDIYALDVGSGTGTSLGDIGFTSAGDLAFVGQDLYLSAGFGDLVSVDLATPSNSYAIGPFSAPWVYGIATDDTSTMFAVSLSDVYQVDTATGTLSNQVSFAGQGLNVAYGQSFFAEAGADPSLDPNGSLGVAPVPLPAGLPLLASGLIATGFLARRRKRGTAGPI